MGHLILHRPPVCSTCTIYGPLFTLSHFPKISIFLFCLVIHLGQVRGRGVCTTLVVLQWNGCHVHDIMAWLNLYEEKRWASGQGSGMVCTRLPGIGNRRPQVFSYQPAFPPMFLRSPCAVKGFSIKSHICESVDKTQGRRELGISSSEVKVLGPTEDRHY
jgi:hypothetical protein